MFIATPKHAHERQNARKYTRKYTQIHTKVHYHTAGCEGSVVFGPGSPPTRITVAVVADWECDSEEGGDEEAACCSCCLPCCSSRCLCLCYCPPSTPTADPTLPLPDHSTTRVDEATQRTTAE